MADDSTLCPRCKGKRTVDVRLGEQARYTTILCTRCAGTGVWMRQEDARQKMRGGGDGRPAD